MDTSSSASRSTFSRQTSGYVLAASVTVLLNTILTWVKILNPAVKLVLANILGNHWVTQGVAIVLVFFALGFLFSRTSSRISDTTLTRLLVSSVVIAALGLIGLFLFE